MKAFNLIMFAACLEALAHAKKMPKKKEPEPVPEPVEPEMNAEDVAYWEYIDNLNGYGKNLWLGVYQGLYGMSSKVERPDDACFGEWIPDHMKELSEFRSQAKEGVMTLEVDLAKKSAYNIVDLIFLNDEYCHFR